MRQERRVHFVNFLIILVLTITATSCSDQALPVPISAPTHPSAAAATRIPALETPILPTPTIAPAELASLLAPPPSYLAQINFTPQQAVYFDLVKRKLALNDDEVRMLARNGFVVSDRLAFADFRSAYAYIYWKDLPVLITTDAILHAMHKTYDDTLLLMEEQFFTPYLKEILNRSLTQAQTDAERNTDPRLVALYTDLQIYLTVPLALLDDTTPTTPAVAVYLKQARDAVAIDEVSLFGDPRKIDFTLFQPRGHYTTTESLQRYFRAMSWLAQVDFRMVEYDPKTLVPQFNIDQLAAAALLRDVMTESGARDTWNELDSLMTGLVGRSDNTTLADLDRFMADAGLTSAVAVVHHPTPDQLLSQLTSGDYGKQRISGQILSASTHGPTHPLPISMMLFGQRFAIDSYVMSELVFDRLIVNGKKVERRLPSPLEVMYTLGNDRAPKHLEAELAAYGHQGNLLALRDKVAELRVDFWDSSVYHRTLAALRELGTPTTATNYPQAMRTAAWGDKMLQTQLGAWAQLRHDNLLYVKEPDAGVPVCSYPAGYVEPYPAFYSSVLKYARDGQALFNNISAANLTGGQQYIRQKTLDYFANLTIVAERLQTMAAKELRLEPFTRDEEAFLKNTAVRQSESFDTVCAGIIQREEWEGWYPSLFPWGDGNPALIADVATAPPSETMPAQVLHAASGPAATLIFIADTDEGPMMYVGPSYTYFEMITTGPQPVRLTDEQWQHQLAASPPTPPSWTESFRLGVSVPSTPLLLPTALPVSRTPRFNLTPTATP